MEKMRKKKGDTGRAILFLAPALLLICCFTVIPIFEAVYTSFHKTQYAMVGEFVGLKNYISVMVESDGLKNIINSIVYVVLSLLLAMPIGIGVGTLLNRKIRGMTIFRTMIIIPWTLSQTVTALLWKWLLNGNYGLITSWAYQLTGKKIGSFQFSNHCKNPGSYCKRMEYGSGRNYSDDSSTADDFAGVDRGGAGRWCFKKNDLLETDSPDDPSDHGHCTCYAEY